MFRTGVQPAWEDKVNALGGDFCIRIMELKNMELLLKLWEELVLDLITKQIPFSEEITGVRILDKSRSGQEQFRFEVWTKFADDNDRYQAIQQHLINNFIS